MLVVPCTADMLVNFVTVRTVRGVKNNYDNCS